AFGTNTPEVGANPITARSLGYFRRSYSSYLGTWDQGTTELGGWAFNEHHAYDVSSGILFMGNGKKIGASDIQVRSTVVTLAGTGESGYSGDSGDAKAAQLNYPISVDIGPDGSIYICDLDNYRIRKV